MEDVDVVCGRSKEREGGVGAHLRSALPFSRPTAGNFPVVVVVVGGGGGGEGDMGTDTCDVRRNGLKREGPSSEPAEKIERKSRVGPCGRPRGHAHPIWE